MAKPNTPEPTVDVSDERLLARFWSERDQEAFAELVRRYQDSAYRIAFARCGRRELCEDAVQEAFLELARKREEAVPECFRTWFFAVVSNMTRNRMRTETRGSRREKSVRYQEEVRMVSADRAKGGVSELDAETRDAISDALGKLNEELRLPLVLYFVEGMTQDQVGEAVGVSQSLIARRISMGLEKLRARLTMSGVAVSAVTLPVMLKDTGLLAAPAQLTHALGSEAFVKLALAGGRHSMRMAATTVSLGKGAVAIVCVAVAAMAGALGFWLYQPHAGPPAPTASVPAAVPATWPVPVHVAELEQSFRDWNWDLLKNGLPKEAVVGGNLAWDKGKGLHTTTTEKASVVLPPLRYKLPLRVTMLLKPESVGPISAGLDLAVGNDYIPSKVFTFGTINVKNFSQEFTVITYLYDDNMLHISDDNRPRVLLKFEGAERFTRMVMTVGNLSVRRVQIEEIRSEEIPASVLEVVAQSEKQKPQVEHRDTHVMNPPPKELLESLNAPLIQELAP